MSARKLEFLSDHLKATRNRLAEYRNCGLMMDHTQVEGLVRRFDQLIEMANVVENEIGRREWGDLLAEGEARRDADHPIGANVVAFPGRTPNDRPTGGNAA